ncbi:MAG: acylphosphatase [Ignavibacteriales bacterium]|nr:acylphosphatase [Ignavibacteriales bacterium]MCF8435941.1 acylphosphatase [Ignavibacteriales bacterium]
MDNNLVRAEILVSGLVQGVGFRYFVITNAERLKLTGFTQNLYSGEVLTVAEGPKNDIDTLFELLKNGPSRAHVTTCKIRLEEYTGEFNNFRVKH